MYSTSSRPPYPDGGADPDSSEWEELYRYLASEMDDHWQKLRPKPIRPDIGLEKAFRRCPLSLLNMFLMLWDLPERTSKEEAAIVLASRLPAHPHLADAMEQLPTSSRTALGAILDAGGWMAEDRLLDAGMAEEDLHPLIWAGFVHPGTHEAQALVVVPRELRAVLARALEEAPAASESRPDEPSGSQAAAARIEPVPGDIVNYDVLCSADEYLCFDAEADPSLPAGTYTVVEGYCADPSCDCRVAYLSVHHASDPQQPWASITFGWEPLSFYVEWFGEDEADDMIVDLKGPALMPMAPQGPHAQALLRHVRRRLRQPAYVEQLRRHYEQFKRRLGKLPHP